MSETFIATIELGFGEGTTAASHFFCFIHCPHGAVVQADEWLQWVSSLWWTISELTLFLLWRQVPFGLDFIRKMTTLHCSILCDMSADAQHVRG